MEVSRNIKVITAVFSLLLWFQTSEAQILKKLIKATEEAAEEAVIRKTEEKVSKETSKQMDTLLNGKKSKKQSSQSDQNKSQNSEHQTNNPDLKPWSRYNFVPGDKIIFHDDLFDEENGEFPSRWDLLKGTAENASFQDINIINFKNKTIITPLMDEDNYLPEVFTIEFDAYFDGISQGPQFWQSYDFRFSLKTGKWYYPTKYPEVGSEDYFSPLHIYRHGALLETKVKGNAKEYKTYEETLKVNEPKWLHIAIAFNKRSLKVFIDQYRVINIPNLGFKPQVFSIDAQSYYADGVVRAIKNIKVAEGGKKLYDRVVADGKFVTRGILFDTNKATIKPESMGVINTVANMMEKHEDLNFSIEGHTDSDGVGDYNLELSAQRAEAVKATLIELGISEERLQTEGKGESIPVADNTTPEGKANNRRVEFIKI